VSTGEHWFVRRYINITNMMEVADLHICDVLLQVRAAIRSVCPLCAEWHGMAWHGMACLCIGSDRAVVTSQHAAGVCRFHAALGRNS
jgi:hypothetical protein